MRGTSASSPFHQDIPCVPIRHDTYLRSPPTDSFQRPHICRYLIQPMDAWKVSKLSRQEHQQVQLRCKIPVPAAHFFTKSRVDAHWTSWNAPKIASIESIPHRLTMDALVPREKPVLVDSMPIFCSRVWSQFSGLGWFLTGTGKRLKPKKKW